MFFSTYPRISFIECLPYIAGMDGAFDLKGKKTCKDCKQPNGPEHKARGCRGKKKKYLSTITCGNSVWNFILPGRNRLIRITDCKIVGMLDAT